MDKKKALSIASVVLASVFVKPNDLGSTNHFVDYSKLYRNLPTNSTNPLRYDNGERTIYVHACPEALKILSRWYKHR